MSGVVSPADFAILRAVIAEADLRWGTEFDDQNTVNDWAAYVNTYVARATAMENRDNPDVQYDAFIKAAGLALTAAARVITGNVAPRHYDS